MDLEYINVDLFPKIVLELSLLFLIRLILLICVLVGVASLTFARRFNASFRKAIHYSLS